jgi:uncharacterized membrane protein
MSATSAPAGWHPDPTGSAGTLRWWDGVQWTEHTRPAEHPPQPAHAPLAVGAGSVPPAAAAAYEQHTTTSGISTFAQSAVGSLQPTAEKSVYQRNPTTFTTIAVAAAYILLAKATGIVLIGFVPIAFAIRAFQHGEQLAPLAFVCAAVVVVFSLSILLHA